MLIGFMGTPDFAIPVLEKLVAVKHEVVAVFTQPAAPVGRGKKLHPSPIHTKADALGLTVHTPTTLKDADLIEKVREMKLDAIVTVAYGLILPPQYLDMPRFGCFNVHASLVPRWRGAAPIQRAILAGDQDSGVSILQMDRGVDTGPVLLSENVAITPQMTSLQLHDVLKELGAKLIIETLSRAEVGALHSTPQTERGSIYAHKLSEDESAIDWTQSAIQIDRQIRAFQPWLSVWCKLPDGDRLKVLESSLVETTQGGKAGEILDDKLTVACGDGALRLTIVQRTGKKPMAADAFLRGYQLPKSSVLR